MHEYYFTQDDFVEHEADMVLSGAISSLQEPKMYKEDRVIHWIYSSDFVPLTSVEPTQKIKEQVQLIKNDAVDYLLNPEKLVYNPDRIQMENGNLKFQYLPKVSSPMYVAEDLFRWMDESKNTKSDQSMEKHDKQAMHRYLYFKDEGRLEEICFDNFTICSGTKCNIYADFLGKALISPDGTLQIKKGNITINGISKDDCSDAILLEKGDLVKFGESLAIFW